LEFSIDWISDSDTAITVPKSHAIEEPLRVFVGELERPGLAAICGLVNAGLLAGARSKKKSRIGAERLYIA
jgi:hypothetical protein